MVVLFIINDLHFYRPISVPKPCKTLYGSGDDHMNHYEH